MLCLVLLIQAVLVSQFPNAMSGAPNTSGTSQSVSESSYHDWYYYEEDHDEGMGCDDDVVDLIISN